MKSDWERITKVTKLIGERVIFFFLVKARSSPKYKSSSSPARCPYIEHSLGPAPVKASLEHLPSQVWNVDSCRCVGTSMQEKIKPSTRLQTAPIGIEPIRSYKPTASRCTYYLLSYINSCVIVSRNVDKIILERGNHVNLGDQVVFVSCN